MSNTIQLISGPRNISTALMYSFGNRGDTDIMDEPFYACYLSRYQVDYHPGTEAILASMSSDPNVVIDSIMQPSRGKRKLFIKNMAHHMRGFDYSYSCEIKNVFLIRDPRQLINSFSKVIEEPAGTDIGVERELELYQELKSKGKYPPLVLDSGEILKDPEKVLKELCYKLEIHFTKRMLSWEPGARKEDGVWAKYWYDNVHKSIGFKKQIGSSAPLAEKFRKLYEEVAPYYNQLFEVAIKA